MKQYFFVITIGALLLSLFFLISFALPQYQDLQTAKMEIRVKQLELQTRENYFKNLNDLDRKLGDHPDEMDKISSAVPGDPSLPSLFNFLQGVASQESLVLKKLAIGQTVLVLEKPLVQKMTLSLEVTGSYENFKKLLSSLEKSSRLIQVESLIFALPEKGESFLFNLTLSVNYTPESLTATANKQ